MKWERTENYDSTLQILSALRSILESSQLNWFGALSTLVISFIFGPRKNSSVHFMASDKVTY